MNRNCWPDWRNEHFPVSLRCFESFQRLGLGPGAVLVGSWDNADRFTNPASQHRNAFSGLGGTHEAGPCCPCVWGRWWYECSAGHARNCNYKYLRTASYRRRCVVALFGCVPETFELGR